MATSFQNANFIPPFAGVNGNCVYTDGTKSIVGTSAGIAYSLNSPSGVWSYSNITTLNWTSLSVIGDNAVICGSDNKGIYYSGDSGQNWIQSNVTTGNFNFILMNTFSSGTKVIACSNSGTGLYYSANLGQTWTNPITTGNFSACTANTLERAIAVTKSGLTTGIYYSTNSGETWTQSIAVGTTTLFFNDVSMSGARAIAAATTVTSGATTKLALWISADSGTNWTQTTTTKTGTVSNKIFTSVLAVLSPTTVYYLAVGTSSGMQSSTSTTGNTFSELYSGEAKKLVQKLGIIMTLRLNSVTKSVNYGVGWTSSTGDISPNLENLSFSGNHTVLCLSSNLGIMYSNSASFTTSTVFQATNTDSTASIISLVSSSVNSIILYNPVGIAYSSNGGVDWTFNNALSLPFFQTVSISGTRAILIGDLRGNPVVYYSTTSGNTWVAGTLTTGGRTVDNINISAINGSNALCSSSITSTTSVFYSNNGGQTWTGISSPINILVNDIKISGNRALICTTNKGIYYSTSSGSSFTQTTTTAIQAFNFYNAQISVVSNLISVAGTSTGGIYYSSNSGQTYTLSTGASGTAIGGGGWSIFNFSGSNIVAGSLSNKGIIYSTDNGASWSSTNKNTLPYQVGFTSTFAELAFAGSNTISTDVVFTRDNPPYGIYNETNISGIVKGITYDSATQNAIIAGNNFLVYSTNVPCFNENTTLLTSSNEYVLISLLKENDILKTYKDGDKKIKYIKSFFIYNDSDCLLNVMYKMKNSDFIITGGHSILVDELDEDEKHTQKKLYDFENKLYDKYFNLACVSKLFEKIEEKKKFILYHVVLENDDETRNYGIYANGGILTDSLSEKYFNRQCKNII